MLEALDPRRVLVFQECHKCHGRGRYKCSGCHGAGMVSQAWAPDDWGWGVDTGMEGWPWPGAPVLTVFSWASHPPSVGLHLPYKK
jgi:hypothetical protein